MGLWNPLISILNAPYNVEIFLLFNLVETRNPSCSGFPTMQVHPCYLYHHSAYDLAIERSIDSYKRNQLGKIQL